MPTRRHSTLLRSVTGFGLALLWTPLLLAGASEPQKEQAIAEIPIARGAEADRGDAEAPGFVGIRGGIFGATAGGFGCGASTASMNMLRAARMPIRINCSTGSRRAVSTPSGFISTTIGSFPKATPARRFPPMSRAMGPAWIGWIGFWPVPPNAGCCCT